MFQSFLARVGIQQGPLVANVAIFPSGFHKNCRCTKVKLRDLDVGTANLGITSTHQACWTSSTFQLPL